MGDAQMAICVYSNFTPMPAIPPGSRDYEPKPSSRSEKWLETEEGLIFYCYLTTEFIHNSSQDSFQSIWRRLKSPSADHCEALIVIHLAY